MNMLAITLLEWSIVGSKFLNLRSEASDTLVSEASDALDDTAATAVAADASADGAAIAKDQT